MGMVKIKRGDIILVNLNPGKGSEQTGVRPCLIIQNDTGNEYSPTTIITAITSKAIYGVFIPNIEFIVGVD